MLTTDDLLDLAKRENFERELHINPKMPDVELLGGIRVPFHGWINTRDRYMKIRAQHEAGLRIALAHEVGHIMTLPRGDYANTLASTFHNQRLTGRVTREIGERVIGCELLAWRWALAYCPDISVHWANLCMRSYLQVRKDYNGEHL